MRKTPAVAYCYTRLRTAGHEEITSLLADAPLTQRDLALISDIINGLDNQALAEKYHKSLSRISQWKRAVFEQLHAYELHNEEWKRRNCS